MRKTPTSCKINAYFVCVNSCEVQLKTLVAARELTCKYSHFFMQATRFLVPTFLAISCHCRSLASLLLAVPALPWRAIACRMSGQARQSRQFGATSKGSWTVMPKTDKDYRTVRVIK